MFVSLLTVLVIVLAVVIGCVLIRYKKKHNPSAVAAATSVPNNATAIAAAKKEKELNEDAFDNMTYNTLRQNDYCNTFSEHKDNTSAAPQNYEVPDQIYEVPYDDEVSYDNVQY